MAEAYAQFLLRTSPRRRRRRRRRDRGIQAGDGARPAGRRDCVGARRSVHAPEPDAGGHGDGGAGAEDRAGESRRPTACSARSTRRWRRRPRARASGRTARRSARTSPRRSSISSRRSKVRWAAPTPIFARCWRGSTSAARSYDKAIAILDRARQAGAAVAGRRHAARRSVLGRRPRRPTPSVGSKRRCPTIPSCIRRSPISTRANASGSQAAAAYEQALQVSPRSPDLRVGYATALMNARRQGRRSRRRATALREAVADARQRRARAVPPVAGRAPRWAIWTRPKPRRGGCRAERPESCAGSSRSPRRSRSGDGTRRSSTRSPPRWRRSGKARTPRSRCRCCCRISALRTSSSDSSTRAVATFEEARKLAPNDPTLTGYLIQAQLAAKNYTAAAELARAGARRPARRSAARAARGEALRQSGRADQGVALLEGVVQKHSGDPEAYIALAQVYSDANRGAQAVKLLQDAQAKFPGRDLAHLRARGRAREAEEVLRRRKPSSGSSSRASPTTPPRSTTSATCWPSAASSSTSRSGLIKRALEIEPDNGSYLDSLGWAYFKSGKLDLAEEHLKRAADQLVTNSVVQDHYGDVLARLGRFDEAIAAWNRALSGDGDSIDRSDIDRKIRSARAKTAQTMILRRGRARDSSPGLLTVSCGAPLMKLPSGPGAPAPDAADASAPRPRRACRAVSSITAEVGVSGSVGGRRLRARLIVGPRGARLGAARSVCVRPADLHLRRAGRRRDAAAAAREPGPRARPCRRGARSRHRHPARRLRSADDAGRVPAASASASRADRTARRARQIGDDWRVVSDGPSELYFRRESRAAPWRLVAAVQRDAGTAGVARGVSRLRERPAADDPAERASIRRRFDLRLALSQVEINVPLDAGRVRSQDSARQPIPSPSRSCGEAVRSVPGAG